VSGASYVEDDAVGYGGASWFCILATSGTDAPDADTTHWALLASQGAIGPQGVQGPTGPQGAGATQTLQQTVNLGNVISDEFETTQTISANRNRFDNTFDNTFGIYGLGFFNKGDGTNAQNIELPETLTGGLKTITFPNATGTVALQTYKEFSGRIFQGSILQPITLTVFKNDFNQLPTVLNDFGSPYDFVISLENQFPQNKTSVKTNVERENIIVSYPDAADNSTVYFNSFDFAGEQAAPASFTFEIRVYN
jgi:hypothetical protein